MNTYPDPALEPRPRRDVRVLNFRTPAMPSGLHKPTGPLYTAFAVQKIRCDARPVSAAGTGKEHVDDNADPKPLIRTAKADDILRKVTRARATLT